MIYPENASPEDILQAGICYAELAAGQLRGECSLAPPVNFPWPDEFWEPYEIPWRNCARSTVLIGFVERSLCASTAKKPAPPERPGLGMPFRGGRLYPVPGTVFEWSWGQYRFDMREVYEFFHVKTFPPRNDILNDEGILKVVNLLNDCLIDRDFAEVIEEIQDKGL